MNISLPDEHISFIDELIARYGFANRSEFVRSIVRFLRRKPQIVDEVVDVPFVAAPRNQSIREIIADFRKTGKYSKAFLKSLEAGLKTSNYFKP